MAMLTIATVLVIWVIHIVHENWPGSSYFRATSTAP